VNDAELVRRKVKEGPKARYPLVKKLSPMDEDQSVSIALRDHLRGDDGLAEGRGRCEHPGFMQEKGRSRLFLFRRQFTEKPRPDRSPRWRSSPQFGGGARIGKKASPWKGDMLQEQLGT
jgi:hypothetical protein